MVKCLGEGYSLTAFAGSIGFARDTVYGWIQTHPEFSDAVAKARAQRTLYWEKRLQNSDKDTRAVTWALRNSCSEEWSNDPEVAVTVHNDVKVDLTKPVAEWGPDELQAALKQMGESLPTPPAVNGHKPKVRA